MKARFIDDNINNKKTKINLTEENKIDIKSLTRSNYKKKTKAPSNITKVKRR